MANKLAIIQFFIFFLSYNYSILVTEKTAPPSLWLKIVLQLELSFSPVDGPTPVFISSSLELFIVRG